VKLNFRWLLPLVGALAVAAWFVLQTDVWQGERVRRDVALEPTREAREVELEAGEARRASAVPAVDAEVPLEAEVAAAPPVAETPDEELARAAAYDAGLPVGTLEVEVRVHGHLVGGRVFAQDVDHMNAGADFDADQRREAPLLGGVARFDGLAGPMVLIGIELGAEPLHRTVVALPQQHGRRRCFDLGSAHVFGSVRTARGEPIAEAQVWLMGSRTTVVVRSDANGAFDGGTRFPAGDVTALLMSSDLDIEEHRSVRTEPLGEHEVNFGLAANSVRWTGRVIGADGVALEAGDAVAPRTIAVRSKANRDTAPGGSWFQFVPVVDGRIDQALAPDVYLLTVGDHFATDPVPSEFDLRTDAVHDVHVPGFVLVGRIVAEARPAALEVFANGQLERPLARPRSDGTFRFVGLNAGPFELWSGTDVWARGAIAADGPLVVDLGELSAPLAD
jgi:hypothetical protein